MHFDFALGNPPYQDETVGDNKKYAPPVYHLFLSATYDVADKVEMIHPARFLFNAGSTPKEWNLGRLNDPHFKVLDYEKQSAAAFPNTDIKGGVCVSYRDKNKDFGAIKVFTEYPALNTITKKVVSREDFKSLTEIMYSRTAYRLTQKLHDDHPDAITKLSDGHAYDMASNIFDNLPDLFFDEKPEDGNEYIRILGRVDSNRVFKFIRKDYVNKVENLDYYKVLVPQANGCGVFGEVMVQPVIEEPGSGTTETFISIGKFTNNEDAEHLKKYVCSKFARTMLGILKVTQNGNKPVWRMIPLQDFSSSSDIDWTQSVHNIDQQLYKKYGLTDEEQAFIESHVKEMD